MSKTQYWTIATEDGAHEVSYVCSFWSGKTVFTIDGETFTQKFKPFHIGIARREIFRLGDEQCVLAVAGDGRAEVLWKGKCVPERVPEKGN